MRATFSAHALLLNVVTEILVGKEYVQIMKLLLTQFSLGFNYFLSLIYSNILFSPLSSGSLAVSFLNVRVPIPYPYKIMKL
jgi:hypothetical protein